MPRNPAVLSRPLSGALLCLALLLPGVAEAQRLQARDPHDPLIPLLRRMDRYFQKHEVDGVTMDWRYSVNPSEAIRMSVVCQVLGYVELHRVRPTARIRTDIVEHTDYLIARLDSVRSHTPFDGMLAYSLLAAYEATGETRFLAQGTIVVDELKAIPTSQCVLNGGLMVAMAMAEYFALTQDPEAGQKGSDILALLQGYQNADGSFPHWCVGSEDIHYTGWMAHELVLIQRMTADPRIEPILSRMNAFLEGRVDSTGRSRYEEPCPDYPGCIQYFYSRATGCSYDYDTRGWTVEPGYTALLLDHCQSPEYRPVMDFLISLEDRGTFPDLYGYWPPPDDPEYVWTIADTSVANMSIIFWSLATILSGRPVAGPAPLDWLETSAEPDTAPAAWSQRHALPGAGARLGPPPNPVRGPCDLRFTLAAPAEVSLVVFDPAGRRVRELLAGPLAAGAHAARWDGRDEAGNQCRSGVYFVRLCAGAETLRERLLLLH